MLKKQLSKQNCRQRALSYDKLRTKQKSILTVDKNMKNKCPHLTSSYQKLSPPFNKQQLSSFPSQKLYHPQSKDIKTTRITQSIKSSMQEPNIKIFQSQQSKQQLNKTLNINKNNHSKLTMIPIIENSFCITQLSYSNNKISIIPNNFFILYPNLIKLNLSNNQIGQINMICCLEKLKELYLAHNLISNIPKDIKKLKFLEHIDLGYNKLWYLTQIVSLKDLVRIRKQEMGGDIAIILEGNSVIKTNQKAVEKLIKYIPIKHLNKNSISPPFPTIKIQSNPFSISNKQNMCPNLIQNNESNLNKHKHTKQTQPQIQKHNRSRSHNQSLLDISAIIGNVPSNLKTLNQQVKKIGSTLQILKKESHELKFVDSPSKNVRKNERNLEESNVKSDTLLFNSPNFQSQQINNQNQIKQIQNYSFLNSLLQTTNFKQNFGEPNKQFLSEIYQLLKKLKVLQGLKQIPDPFKGQLFKINQEINLKLNETKLMLQTFLNFYIKKNLNFLKLKLFKNFKEQSLNTYQLQRKIKNFHQKILLNFINASNISQIKWYEIWMHQYQKFKKIMSQIQNFVSSILILSKKLFKISKIDTILCSKLKFQQSKPLFKQKNNNQQLFSSKKICQKQSKKQQLRNLLFSDSKQLKKSLFLSEKKSSESNYQQIIQANSRKSSKKQNSLLHYQNQYKQQYCLQCPLKIQQIENLNISIIELNKNAQFTKIEIDELQNTIKKLNQRNQMHEQLLQKQQQIILYLQTLRPSTYQNLMLEQAKTIQELIFNKNYFFIQNNFNKAINYFQTQQINNSQTEYYQKNNKNQISACCFQAQNMQFVQNSKPKINGLPYKIDLNQINNNKRESFTKKNSQNLQRTYFKSNHTFQNQNSETTKCKKSKSKSSAKVKTQIEELKENSNKKIGYGAQQFDQNLENMQRSSFQKIKMNDNENNELFSKIFVRECDEKNNKNKNFIMDNQIKNKNSNDQYKILKAQKQNDVLNINRNHQKSQRENNVNQNFSLNVLKFSKTHSQTHQIMELLKKRKKFAKGYDFQTWQIQENKQYKKYIKNYLRNNIKQILQRRTISASKSGFKQRGEQKAKNQKNFNKFRELKQSYSAKNLIKQKQTNKIA